MERISSFFGPFSEPVKAGLTTYPLLGLFLTSPVGGYRQTRWAGGQKEEVSDLLTHESGKEWSLEG